MDNCLKSGIIFRTQSDHYAYFSHVEFKSSTKPFNKRVNVDAVDDAEFEPATECLGLSLVYENDVDKDILLDPSKRVYYGRMERTILISKDECLLTKTVAINYSWIETYIWRI